MSLPARMSRLAVVSAVSCSSLLSATHRSQVACRFSTLAMTSASASCTFLSFTCSAWSVAIDSASTSFLGSTTLATSSYTFIARTHMQSDLAADETFCTLSGSNSSSL